MFRWLIKKMQSFLLNKTKVASHPLCPAEDSLTTNLRRNLNKISELLAESPDLKIRKFTINVSNKAWEAAIVFIDGLVNTNIIEDHILRPLMVDALRIKNEIQNPPRTISWIENHLLTVNSLAHNYTFDEVLSAVLAGDTVLLTEGLAEGLQISSKGWERRSVQEPDTEVTIKGAREGFIENIRTNTALLRRKVGHPNLTFEGMMVGRKSKTNISLAYIRGLVNEELLKEVRRRIRRIDTDAVLDAGILEQYIEDAPFSLFPTVNYTERPEIAAARILEGRVAVMIDGTPVVNTVPMLFFESFQTADDYNFRWIFATTLRWVRFLAFMLTIIMPALYVALTTFHQEMIPTPLLISMAAAEEGIPFPAAFEVLIMGIIFEILREAGIRLPRPVGSAVNIVGALVIGDTAVNAGIVGAPVVIVVALTAISSFVIPFQVESVTLIRLGFVMLAGIFGLYGIVYGLLLILIHLASLSSFGTPYLSPLAPWGLTDLKDTVFRAPFWMLFTRPKSLEPRDSLRQSAGLAPESPDPGKG